MNSGHRLTLTEDTGGDVLMIMVEGIIMTGAIMMVMAMGIVGAFKALLPRRTQQTILNRLAAMSQED